VLLVEAFVIFDRHWSLDQSSWPLDSQDIMPC